jgi:Tol biopolymer transport system component
MRILTLMAMFVLLLVAPAAATFSGPDGRVAYNQFTGVADIADLFLANADGSDPEWVAADAWKSNWSGAGDLVYMRRTTDAPDAYNIFLRRPSGATAQITSGEFWHGSPAFSPDGARIVFETDFGDYPAREGLYVMNRDGTRVRQLVSTPDSVIFDQDPSWSPDGSRIAFLRIRSGEAFRGRAQKWWGHHYQAAIFTVRQDGSDLRRITPWGGNVGYPDWSPDGRRLVVTAHWDTRPGASSAVYTMRPDGKDLEAVFDAGPNTANGSADPDASGAYDPHFSPSGKRIVFGHWPGFGQDAELASIRVDGTDKQTLARGFIVLPSWGPLS